MAAPCPISASFIRAADSGHRLIHEQLQASAGGCRQMRISKLLNPYAITIDGFAGKVFHRWDH
jgi:hypothetical protein